MGVVVAVLVAAVAAGGATAASPPHRTTVVTYDDFQAPGGYDLADFDERWTNPYGPGELAAGGTRTFGDGAVEVDATPFQTGVDLSVFDHIKYLATSTRSFAVPDHGSVMFEATISAETPGTQPGRTITGTYVQDGTPYEAQLLEGQQAGATLHMIDFRTGQLFDWFVSGSTAFTLVERLPDSVIGSGSGGTRDTMYTQILSEVPIEPGPHRVGIRFTRTPGGSAAEWFLDGQRIDKIHHVGVPVDVQHRAYTGLWPSMGPGEDLSQEIDSLTIGHGLFSLLDPFPFQHPDAPELAVSIPVEQRLFGQGARATFDDVVVTTVEQRPEP